MYVTVAPRPEGVAKDLGRPELPGSKSHTQRAMLLAAGAGRRVRLVGALRARDTEVLARALEALGARFEWDGADLVVDPGLARGASADVDLEENGTALRTLLVVVPMLGGRLRVDGSPRLAERPVDEALEVLRRAGARVEGERLPLVVDGRTARAWDGLEVDARRTTQVASGVLAGLALRARLVGGGGGLVARAPSAPGYVRLTAHVAARLGWTVQVEERGADLGLRVVGTPRPAPAELRVPPDASALAFPLALAAMHGRAWRPRGLPAGDPHPDLRVLEDVDALRTAPAGARFDLDLGGHPDSFCALAALAATRAGVTRLAGAPALRLKESDRIAAMARGLAALGARVEELEDGLVVHGPIARGAGPVAVPATADHRVVMALALLGTVRAGGVRLPHPGAVAKSWPGFFDWLGRTARVTRHE